MNKKTTRLSSIALALMMVLMVALTLVPVGAAGAASASVEIEIDSSSIDDSENVVLLEDKVTIKVSEVLWDDDKVFESVKMTLLDPNDAKVSGYDPKTLTETSSGSGIYSGTYQSGASDPTGLYTMELRRYYSNGTMDQEAITVAAFWLAREGTAGVVLDAAVSGDIIDTSNGKLYTAPENKVELTFNTPYSAAGDIKIRVNGKFLDDEVRSNATTTVSYDIPENAKHGAEYEFNYLFVRDNGEASYHKAIVSTTTYVNAKAPLNVLIIDAEGPSIGEIYITGDEYVGYVYDNVMFETPGDGDTFVEVKNIKDDSGVHATDAPFVRFVNVLNAKQKHETGALVANTAYSDYLTTSTDNWGYKMLLSGTDVPLVDQQWYMEIVATDVLGNESVKRYGKVTVLEDYFAVTNIRVESQNVIEMYKGQTLSLEDLINRNVTVAMEPTNASFTDSSVWTWALNAAASGIITIDEDTNAVTATATGEARLYAKVLPKYNNEISITDSDYLRIKVTESPTVSSITLNNSTMNIAPGASQKLTATTNPAGVDVTWESSSSAVATVSADGTVTGVANGTAVIFAKAGAQVASCTVTVSGGSVTVTGISLNKTAMSLTAGASETLFATTTPAGGAISWNTSDAAVATVDNAGKVTAQKAGTATITATSGSYSATCVVTVTGTPETLEPNQWYQDDAGNIYYSNEHSQLTVGWKKIGGYWYLFDYSTAVMKKGWAKDAGTWYYLQSDGKMKTGWLKDGSTWYYLQASGAMKTGWLKDGGVWYYLKDSGAMATGWVKVSGIWYYLQGSGAMKEGWLLESGVWYYLTPSSGAMLANGTYTVEGRKSQFAASGRWLGYV